MSLNNRIDLIGSRKTYAGIGNREISGAKDGDHGLPIAKVLTHLGIELEKTGYMLYSGEAKGCDAAFANGVSEEHCRIFTANDATDETRAMARAHKLPSEILLGRKLDLYASEVFQILGPDMNSPVDFVLCYTRDGCESYETRSEKTGGTGFAIELASRRGIPVINLKNKGWEQRMHHVLSKKCLIVEKFSFG